MHHKKRSKNQTALAKTITGDEQNKPDRQQKWHSTGNELRYTGLKAEIRTTQALPMAMLFLFLLGTPHMCCFKFSQIWIFIKITLNIGITKHSYKNEKLAE